MRFLSVLGAAAMCFAQGSADFAGTWVFRAGDQAILKLSLTAQGGTIRGALTKPRGSRWRALRLERAPDGKPVILATRVAERQYPEDIVRLREQLRSMVAAEQEARLAYDQPRWKGIDAKNRPEAPRILDRYGRVTKSLAGSDAAHDYWLLVQHQTLEIQQRLLPALEKAELFLLPVAEYLGTEYFVKFCAGK